MARSQSRSRPGFPGHLVFLGLLGLLGPAPGLASLAADLPAQAHPGPQLPIRQAADSSTPRVLAKQWSRKVDRAVEAGLGWLSAQRQEKGYWTGITGHKQGDSYYILRSVEEQKRRGQGHLGVTALAGIAFLAGGHLPDRGRHGKLVRAVLDYMLDHVGQDGLLTDGGTRMYSHAFGTLFLAEVYGMSKDTRIKPALERAVHLIVDSQNAKGAWRYNPFSIEADLSVTVCQLQALRAARNIGIKVDRTVIDRAVAYVRQSQTPSGPSKGLYYYKIHGRGSRYKNRQYAINAAAVTSLVSAGIYDRGLLEPALLFLEEEQPLVSQYEPHHFYFWYGNYYASQAFLHAEGIIDARCFERYYASLSSHLLSDQESDGRWQNRVGPGDAFATAVACIILQMPKQYLPIFQR